ncbi:MAG: PEP-CTERM system TPR-repeat protein PrsT, partial [Alphaproteobacteria bacterium]|nr:PEP-CTERM system TPR-repeat protein PrsT [Alphaproteobacteria bacterium]
MTKKPLGNLAAAALLISIVTSAQAADPKRAQSYLEDAKRALDKGDVKSAAIQLKNAVQADPGSGVARYELGVVELRLGDYLSAEKELRAAVDRNYDRDRVAPRLADTLLHLHKDKELLDEIGPGDRAPDLESDVRIARGYAQLDLHRPDDAKKSFEEALARAATPVRAELGLARVSASEGKLAEALDLTQKALESDPDAVDAWVFHAKLKRAQGDLAAARDDLDKSLTLNPDYEAGRLDRASLLIAKGDLDLASADLKAVLKTDPNQPLAAYYQALIHAKRKDFRAAATSLQNLKGFVDAYPPAIYLLAAINFAQGEFAQAEENADRFLARTPGDESGAALLASLLLRRGNASRAIEVTKAALDAHPQSLRLMGLLSDAYARNKQPDEAAAILDRAAASHPDDAELRTRIGAQRLRIGRPDEALADLETATELSPKSEQAGLLLVLTLLQTNKVDEALKAAGDLRDRLPDDPVPENLIGAIALRQGDLAAAKAHFERALQIKPDFNPATMNLAQIAVAEKRNGDARGLYDGILKRDPLNVGALMAQANLSLGDGKTNDAALWLEKARNGNAAALPPRLRLIELYIRMKETAKASDIANEVAKIAPDDAAATNAVGEARLANNEVQAAVTAFQHLTALAPASAAAQLQLGRAHYAAQDKESARADLEKAVQLNPGVPAIEQQFIRLAIEGDTVPRE